MCTEKVLQNKEIITYRQKHALSVALTIWASFAKKVLGSFKQKGHLYVMYPSPTGLEDLGSSRFKSALARANASFAVAEHIQPKSGSFADCKTSTTATYWPTSFALQQEYLGNL